MLTHVEHNLAVDGAAELDPVQFAELMQLEVDGALTATQAKQVLAEMVETGATPEAIAAAHGFEAMDTGALEALVDEVMASHPDDWAKFLGGDDKVDGFFVGQVMKATQGKADGKALNALLRQRRDASG